ncbi:hypothetical protein ACFX1Q_045453 [Malus domestica]
MMFLRGRLTRSNYVIASFVNRMLFYIFVSYAAVLLCSSHPFCCARDTITYGAPITDGVESGTLVSSGGRFELGFFSPSLNGTQRYVGIWYHQLSPRTVVWVANRETPVLNSTSTGFLALRDGNLQVLDTTGKSYWSTTAETSESLTQTVTLMDSGNLVLSSGDDKLAVNILWQSFQRPTDTFIPGMVLDKSLELTSWRGEDDPAKGKFIFKQDQVGENQYVISKSESILYWKGGEPATDAFYSFDQMLPAVTYLLSNFSKKYVVRNSPKIFSSPSQNSTYKNITIPPRSEYDYTSCNSNNRPLLCKCLPGFKPQYLQQWNSGDFSGGCTREYALCGDDKNDTFLSLKKMKVVNPDLGINVDNETECRNMCLTSCQCNAYSYANFSQRRDAPPSLCRIWDSVNNLEEEYTDRGQDLSVRVVLSDLEGNLPEPSKEDHTRRKLSLSLIIVAVLLSVIFLACIVISIYIWRRNMNNKRDQIRRGQFDSERRVKELIDTSEFKEEEGIDVPFFDLQTILDATDNFSNANKLGQGGYGPVYKGMFLGGQEIAVKRLSRVSGQGLQEFRNEVVLIAKLQHRNLVRLKGYCMKGEEKILLYEYMPNISLDSFIFDHTKSMFLNWEMRFSIILGIARGLLYLHQDSRLRIIHRDLKTSNILLDEEMNPKISDFGLARIVGGKETQANTNTVVGTYGYMSPEYALDGTFSVKSDVFSFGVVLLEIISGKKNTGFYQSKQTFSLINYAWRLWTENKVQDLMDKTLEESCNESQFIKCVNVGLLCVQEDPSDRHSMSNVITMLDSETAMCPAPKQPAFLTRRGNSSTAFSPSKPEIISEISNSLVEGR